MKNEKPRFAVLGTDKRQAHLREMLTAEGCEVTREPACEGEIVIGPVPCAQETFDAEPVFSRMAEGQLFIAGAISEKVRAQAAQYGVWAIDLLECEKVAAGNAVPTAEGAIEIAMRESDITLCGSKCLVLGYGRCGKPLARGLNGLGAEVCVSRRRNSAVVYPIWYTKVYTDALADTIADFDFIFNTIPAPILTAELLARVRKDAIIIDIASAPGGVDYAAAKKLGIKALLCPGLPGIAAPKTAAEMMKNEIGRILDIDWG